MTEKERESELSIHEAEAFEAELDVSSAESLETYEAFKDLKRDDAENEITSVLSARFLQGNPYTSIGSNVLIAINPFVKLEKQGRSIYDDAVASFYWNRAPHLTSPHIFKLAAACLHNLSSFENNQTIIISGESGAGKTESAKQILSFITSIASIKPKSFRSRRRKSVVRGGTQALSVNRALVDTNPVLEAFGNARTNHNNNSSRFGKLLELRFSGTRVVSGRVHAFMLEKSRLVNQNVGEGTFHIMNFLLDGAPRKILSELEIAETPLHSCRRGYFEGPEPEEDTSDGNGGNSDDEGSDAWRYMNIEGADESHRNNEGQTVAERDFARVAEAMVASLGISEATMTGLWQLLAALLHLGQIIFVEGNEDGTHLGTEVNSGGVDENRHIQAAAKLLGVPARALHKALSEHIIGRVGRRTSIQTKFLNKCQASANRDALSKEIYQRIFDWVLRAANRATNAVNIIVDNDPATKLKNQVQRSISILDIYGFEIFEVNGFEQLLINYANERLQLFFIENSLRREQEEYTSEGIGWEPVTVADNHHVCTLFDSHTVTMGLFAIIDNQDFSQSLSRGGSAKKAMIRNSNTTADAEDIEDSRALLDVLDETLATTDAFDDPINDTDQSTSATIDADGTENSTEGLVFVEAEMRFVKKPTPPNHVYDEVNMTFVPVNRSSTALAAKANISSPQSLPTTGQGALSRRPYIPSRHYMSRTKNGDLAGQLFGIRHYAGEVAYHAAHLVEKNRDALYVDALHLLQTSENLFVAKIFSCGTSDRDTTININVEEDAQAITHDMATNIDNTQGSHVSASAVPKGKESLCRRMQADVAELLMLLERGNPHYVRCIRPNAERRSGKVDINLIAQQVRYLGLMQSISVRRVGYCFNMMISDFVNRYRPISRKTWPPHSIEEQTAAEDSTARKKWLVWAAKSILSSGEPSEWSSKFPPVPSLNLTERNDFVLGRSKVFIKHPKALTDLETARRASLMPVAAIIQARWRLVHTRSAYLKMRASSVRIQARARQLNAEQRKKRALIGVIRAQARLRSVVASRAVKKSKAQIILQRNIRRLVASLRVQQMRVQFKSQPPRIWAIQIQRFWRSFNVRNIIDIATRNRCLTASKKIAFFSASRRAAATALANAARRRAARRKWYAIKDACGKLNGAFRIAIARQRK